MEFVRLPVSWREFLGGAVRKMMMINGMVRNDVREGGVGWVGLEGRGGVDTRKASEDERETHIEREAAMR